MKILHVLHHSLPELTGYAVRSHEILRFQAGLGFEVAAVTSARAGADQPDHEFDGITYGRVPAAGGLLADTRATARRVTGMAQAIAPDIIHSHSPWLCAWAGLAASRRTGAPFVYEVRDFWEEASVAIGKFGRRSPQYLAARAVDTFLLKRARRVVTISQAQREALIARGLQPDKIVVAPNGVDAERFAPRPRPDELLRRYALTAGAVIGYAGSFLRYEGLEVLIRAFVRVLAACPQARLLLVGWGEEAPGLQRLASSLGVGHATVFAGAVPHAEVGDYYAAMDLLVYPRLSNPSTRSTTPLKPLEAMAMAKPVVASDLPALREIVAPGDTGLLCPPGDDEALAQSCLSLLRSPERCARLGSAARASMLETRAWRRTLSAYPALYAGLVGAAPKASASAGAGRTA